MRKVSKILFLLLMSFPMGAQELPLWKAIEIAQDSAVTAFESRNVMYRDIHKHEQFLSSRKMHLTLLLEPGIQKSKFEPYLNYFKTRDYNMFNLYGELRLEQQANRLGGNFYASTGAMWTEFLGTANEPRLFSTVPIGVGYSNSLIGYNPYKWQKRIEDFRRQSVEKEYQHSLSKIALQTVRLYMDCLVAQCRLEIAVKNAEVTARMLETGKEKFSMASITKNEYCALELQSVNAENGRINAERDFDNARRSLLSYLRMEDSALVMSIPKLPQIKNIPLEEALRLAFDNNPEYRNSCENVISASQKLDKARVQASLLQTSVDLSVGLQNNAPLPKEMYLNRNVFAIGGITLRIPIFDSGLAKNRKSVAEYDLKAAGNARDEKARRLELEVTLALRDFNKEQELIQRTQSVLSLADDSFALAEELYLNGETDINTLVIAQNRKDDAHFNYLNSLRRFWESYYTLVSLCVFEF